jgi:hypothetical protein
VDPDPQHCILACHMQIDEDPDPAYTLMRILILIFV